MTQEGVRALRSERSDAREQCKFSERDQERPRRQTSMEGPPWRWMSARWGSPIRSRSTITGLCKVGTTRKQHAGVQTCRPCRPAPRAARPRLPWRLARCWWCAPGARQPGARRPRPPAVAGACWLSAQWPVRTRGVPRALVWEQCDLATAAVQRGTAPGCRGGRVAAPRRLPPCTLQRQPACRLASIRLADHAAARG